MGKMGFQMFSMDRILKCKNLIVIDSCLVCPPGRFTAKLANIYNSSERDAFCLCDRPAEQILLAVLSFHLFLDHSFYLRMDSSAAWQLFFATSYDQGTLRFESVTQVSQNAASVQPRSCALQCMRASVRSMKLNLNCPTCGDGYGGTLGMKVFLQNCLAVGKWHGFTQFD